MSTQTKCENSALILKMYAKVKEIIKNKDKNCD